MAKRIYGNGATALIGETKNEEKVKFFFLIKKSREKEEERCRMRKRRRDEREREGEERRCGTGMCDPEKCGDKRDEAKGRALKRRGMKRGLAAGEESSVEEVWRGAFTEEKLSRTR